MCAANFVLCFSLAIAAAANVYVAHRADWSRALVPGVAPHSLPLSSRGSANKLALYSPTAANQCAQRGVKATQARRTPVGSQKGGHR